MVVLAARPCGGPYEPAGVQTAQFGRLDGDRASRSVDRPVQQHLGGVRSAGVSLGVVSRDTTHDLCAPRDQLGLLRQVWVVPALHRILRSAGLVDDDVGPGLRVLPLFARLVDVDVGRPGGRFDARTAAQVKDEPAGDRDVLYRLGSRLRSRSGRSGRRGAAIGEDDTRRHQDGRAENRDNDRDQITTSHVECHLFL